jgi:beta-1,2-mannobiose phosphorylase / 1,2-beta-oligomannan phosphorylase
MADLGQRFANNPILTPDNIKPSRPDMVVECLLNPGVFRHNGRTGLLLRVAERPVQEQGWISFPIVDPESPGGVKILRFRKDDPAVDCSDPRIVNCAGVYYLTTLSHLRLAWSDDGQHFTPEESPTLIGDGPLQSFGIEDSRVATMNGQYHLTYTAVSPAGVAVAMTTTTDWKTYQNRGIIFPPHNKDCALFEQKVGGMYYALHRPSGLGLGGNFIWIARSPDLIHWGGHQCLAMTRAATWDSARVGAGASPILTDHGWLEIYHGADAEHRYCLGLLLLDRDDPTKVRARSEDPIMEPVAEYEQKGFFGNVVFTNGHVIDGDRVTVYYGASDTVICAATFSLQELLGTLG